MRKLQSTRSHAYAICQRRNITANKIWQSLLEYVGLLTHLNSGVCTVFSIWKV